MPHSSTAPLSHDLQHVTFSAKGFPTDSADVKLNLGLGQHQPNRLSEVYIRIVCLLNLDHGANLEQSSQQASFLEVLTTYNCPPCFCS
jgi:hypothetical protein